MKYLSNYFSILFVVLLIGYIIYNEAKPRPQNAPLSNAPKAPATFAIDNPAPGGESPYLNAKSFELPKDLYFSGERVPLEIPDVRERLDRELHINTYWHSSTIFLIKKAHRWLPQIEEILKKEGIPDDFKYLTAIESGFINAISPANAVGFWQIRKGTAKEYGLEVRSEVDERYDPLKSTVAASKYLKRAYAKFGSWTNVAASYNRGMAGLQRALDNQNVESYYDLLLNDETSRYVFRILAIKEIINDPKKYGFDINQTHLYEQEELRYVEVEDDIDDLVEFAQEQGINYKLLKRHNPWLRKEHLNTKRKSYKIAIPVTP